MSAPPSRNAGERRIMSPSTDADSTVATRHSNPTAGKPPRDSLSPEPLNITELAAATGASDPTVHVAVGQMLKFGLLSVAQENRLLLAIGHENEWLKELYRDQG